jgi:hypothetical protein
MELKRSIPHVAAATLILGGSSCGKGSSVSSVARLSCVSLRECAPSYFDANYDSIGECTRSRTNFFEDAIESYEDYVGEAIDPRCYDAAIAYHRCYFSEYRAECSGDDAYYACEAEYNAYYARCDYSIL